MNPTNEVRMKFQEYMRMKSKKVADLWNGERYSNKNIQTKWLYFLAGWTMKGK
jgi:hypothetical protein